MPKTRTKANMDKLAVINTEMRLDDVPRSHIPWKEMVVGGIYQRKNGRYFIYAGRADVYHKVNNSLTSVSEPKFYTYIQIDYPAVLTSVESPDVIKIIASSAKLRSSEYRDIARTLVGMLPDFTAQPEWHLADFVIRTDPLHVSKGATKLKVKFSTSDTERLKSARIKEQTEKARAKRKKSSKQQSQSSAVTVSATSKAEV